MKTKILAMQAVVTADMKYEDMEKIQKYAPEKMVLTDKDGNEKFRVGIGCSDGVSSIGISFIKDGENAIARINIPQGIEDKTQYVADNYGIAIAQASEVMKEMQSALAGVTDTIEAIKGNIDVVE